MQQATVTAQMADGSTIVEHPAEFGEFVALVLAFRRDSECVRLEWHQMPPRPDALTRHVEQVYRQTQRGRQTGCSPAAA
ncbi:MAG: hypothetical protein ACR2QA_02955 [Solirubrobacteraceae bacterium]